MQVLLCRGTSPSNWQPIPCDHLHLLALIPASMHSFPAGLLFIRLQLPGCYLAPSPPSAPAVTLQVGWKLQPGAVRCSAAFHPLSLPQAAAHCIGKAEWVESGQELEPESCTLGHKPSDCSFPPTWSSTAGAGSSYCTRSTPTRKVYNIQCLGPGPGPRLDAGGSMAWAAPGGSEWGSALCGAPQGQPWAGSNQLMGAHPWAGVN